MSLDAFDMSSPLFPSIIWRLGNGFFYKRKYVTGTETAKQPILTFLYRASLIRLDWYFELYFGVYFGEVKKKIQSQHDGRWRSNIPSKQKNFELQRNKNVSFAQQQQRNERKSRGIYVLS